MRSQIMRLCVLSPMFTMYFLLQAGFASSAVLKVLPGESISAAIQAAPPGSTIQIAAGTFVENLSVTKPLTLEGAGWTQTIVKAMRSITMATEQDMDEAKKAIQAAPSEDVAAKVRLAWAEKLGGPTLSVRGYSEVVIRGIQFVAAAAPSQVEGLLSEPVVRLAACTNLTMVGCGVTGPFWDGIHVVEGSTVTIAESLVAGFWGTGIVIEGAHRSTPGSSAIIRDSDVRNCYHRGITIGTASPGTVIARCRISGSAWHGIRYDGASPTVEGCAIFANARSGIYASGKTEARIEGNVFFANEMNGLSCWFANRDLVVRNTFAKNRREAVAVIADSKPRLQNNIFFEHPVAVLCSRVSGEKESVVGSPMLQGNVFWKNERDYDSGSGPTSLPGTDNRIVDPLLRNPVRHEFTLAADSPARTAGTGASSVISLESPFPLTAGELAIVPEGDGRDSRAWKKPGK